MKLLLALFVTLFTTYALADQCTVIDQAQANAFTNIVKVGDYVGSLCEPCGEQPTEMGGPAFEMVKSLEVVPFNNEGNVVIKINGKEVDLAYTYVETTKTYAYSVAINAAYLVGCEARDVTNRFVIGE